MNIRSTAQRVSKLAIPALCLLIGACAPSVEQPQPAPAAPPRAQPAAPLPPAPERWIDAPQTSGDWSYRATPSGGHAQFATPTGKALFSLHCDRTARRVTLLRHGGTAPAMLRILTGTQTRIFDAAPQAAGTIGLSLDARDPLLDAVIFSRGRFAVEAGTLPTLYLPSWPEIARVVEDCR